MGIDAAPADTLTVAPDVGEGNDIVDVKDDLAGSEGDGAERDSSIPANGSRWSVLRRPAAIGAVIIVALSGLVGWLGFQYQQTHSAQEQRGRYLQTARAAAVNLTTINWEHADDDVRRIMDGATGEFYDEFAQRSQPFVEVVKQAKSISVGTVIEAGLESQTGTEAQALVAVSVKTSNTTGEEPLPRAWRMRISVQQLDDQLKVSKVEFVP